MYLYLIRHGVANSNQPDPSLSTQGREDIELLIQNIMNVEFKKPEIVFTSPLRRALETADIITKPLKINSTVVEWLKPGHQPSKIFEELNPYSNQNIMLVGHQPTLGWLLSSLVWGLPPKDLSIPPGSLAHLKLQSWQFGEAKIEWIVDPEYFRRKK